MASEKLVEDLFRQEYGKILATLTRFFGPSYIELAEDVVQDTLIAAIEHWGKGGVPENPTSWLIQVAKRKALNQLRREKLTRGYERERRFAFEVHQPDEVFMESEIPDNQLRMIFTCCHPLLDTKSQIALTLKTLCGFSIPEVASALLTNTSTINKRLYRAKEKIRNANVAFSVPMGAELQNSLEAVLLTLYLLFNEGYNSSTSNEVIRKELCLESLRLVHLIADQIDSDGKAQALLALMCFHIARFDARIDDKGGIVLFQNQDRSKWNAELIEHGINWLQASIGGKQLSAYHIEARIAAEHCTSRSFEETNWHELESQYELLLSLKPSAIISLNLAIIKSQTEGWKPALDLLHSLENHRDMKEYHLLSATLGMGYMVLEDWEEAKHYFDKSLKQKPPTKERSFIEGRIITCRKRLRQ